MPRDALLATTMGSLIAGAAEVQPPPPLPHFGEMKGEVEVVNGRGERRLLAYRALSDILPGLHMSVFRDVTDASAAWAAQARLAAIVEHSPDAIMRIGLDGRIELWNLAAERLYGYTAAEVLGRPMGFLEPPERDGEIRALWERVRSGETITELETVRRRKDGSDVAVSLTIAPIRTRSGRVIGGSGTVRDLSERKRADRRFRAFLESAPDGMVVVDAAGRIELVNRRLEELTGYDRRELVGQAIGLLIPAELRDSHARFSARYATAPAPRPHARPVRAARKDGSEFDAEVTLSPLRQEDGELLVMASVRDVTERNRLREQLMIADRMVSLGTVAAGVAHEINNPLAAIVANVAVTLGELEDPERRADRPDEMIEALRDAREAAERVRLIVRDLKLFSRSEEALRPVDVQRVLESTLRMAWNEIRHRARLVKLYGPAPPVHASEAKLGQVFLNLVVNAAQAIPEGHAERNEIRITTAVDASGSVVVTIADSGCGMPPAVLDRLFVPFFTTKPVGQGTGLGLSIVHRLVTSFGGRIAIDSAVGLGTEVRVVLPPAVDREEGHAAPSSVPLAGRRGRILVVDDEPSIGSAVRRILDREHEVTVLTGAGEALGRIASGERFDVILCDLMMPELTGMDLHAALLADCPEQAARMIFMTGGAFTPRAREFLDRTANLRLEKPFDAQQLRALVNEKAR
jgi:PAS domain S-box-containing protein